MLNATRVTLKDKNSLLDHVYSNLEENKLITKTLAFDISDHLPNLTLIEFHKNKSKKTIRKTFTRDLKNFQPDQFLTDLQNNLDKLETNTTLAEESWNSFEQIFLQILNKHAPLRQHTRRENKLFNKPWLTRELLESIKTKNKLYKKLVNNTTKTDTDWIHYKKYKNKLTHLIEQSKRKYFKMKIINSKGNSKKLWKTINNKYY